MTKKDSAIKAIAFRAHGAKEERLFALAFNTVIEQCVRKLSFIFPLSPTRGWRKMNWDSTPPSLKMTLAYQGSQCSEREGIRNPICYQSIHELDPHKIHFARMLVYQQPPWKDAINLRRLYPKYSSSLACSILEPGTFFFKTQFIFPASIMAVCSSAAAVINFRYFRLRYSNFYSSGGLRQLPRSSPWTGLPIQRKRCC